MFIFFDKAAFALINGHARHPALDVILPLFSERILLWTGLALLLAWYALYCRRRYGEALWRVIVLSIFLALSAGAADFSCNLIKDSVGRYRPFQTVDGAYHQTADGAWTVIEAPAPAPETKGTSFPSAHAAVSMAVALVVSLLFRQANPWVYLLPFMVGWSRVYMGKHFLLDVLAGWLVGVLSVLAVWWLCHCLFMLFARRRKPTRGIPG